MGDSYDETGDRNDGTHPDHVAHQYLGLVGRIANSIVTVTSLWADEDDCYSLHDVPYTPARRLRQGKGDPATTLAPRVP